MPRGTVSPSGRLTLAAVRGSAVPAGGTAVLGGATSVRVETVSESGGVPSDVRPSVGSNGRVTVGSIHGPALGLRHVSAKLLHILVAKQLFRSRPFILVLHPPGKILRLVLVSDSHDRRIPRHALVVPQQADPLDFDRLASNLLEPLVALDGPGDVAHPDHPAVIWHGRAGRNSGVTIPKIPKEP